MKKTLMACFIFLYALCGYSEDLPADDILEFVRSKLPAEPFKLTGSLRIKAPNGFTKDNLPVEMELNWGATTPAAKYAIGKETLTLTWNNNVPDYQFSNPKNKPTGDILGSGVNWADLSFSVLWWPNSKLAGEGKKLDRSCYIVEVPVPGSENTMRLWIEKKMGMLLESLTMNKKGKAVRRLKIKSIKKMDGMWIGSNLEIKDMVTGSKTDLLVKNLEWKTPKPTAAAFDPAESVNTLAFELYEKLAAENEGNLFFSPCSISSALAMAYGGARGETAGQMNDVLHFGGQDATHPAFAHLWKTLDNIERKGAIQLGVANALWPQKGFAILPDYLALTQKYYGSEIHSADFIADAESAGKGINQWVEMQTHGKIKNLIGENVLDSPTRLVLANAIHFKGDWAAPFKPEATRPAPFHRTDGTTNPVPMMSQTGDFNLARTDTLQALELPYEGSGLSMVILLPNPGQPLKPTALDELEFHEMEVAVQLPRFKLESSVDLGDTLAAMGMPLAFSSEADFSGMNGTKELHITKVLHKAFVEVNEKGTEAAVATAVAMSRGIPPQFIADRPFLFLIREKSTGTILFIGRVTDPR